MTVLFDPAFERGWDAAIKEAAKAVLNMCDDDTVADIALEILSITTDVLPIPDPKIEVDEETEECLSG